MFVVDFLPLEDKGFIFWVSQDIAHTQIRTGEHWLWYTQYRILGLPVPPESQGSVSRGDLVVDLYKAGSAVLVIQPLLSL